jgi:YfiH family protein
MFEVAVPGARALFTTRGGGKSAGPYASRNLGLFTDDDDEVVRENIDALKEELGLESIQLLRQVHGDELITVSPSTHGTIPIADGAVITESDVGILVTGADCPTVVLASENRLAVLHCGWRPVSDDIIEKAAEHFQGEEYDAVIGPGICQKHFEVGPEVIEAMGPDGAKFADGRQLDLPGIIAHRLNLAGADRVHTVDRCTYCEPELFYSHRRDAGITGRQAGIAWRI